MIKILSGFTEILSEHKGQLKKNMGTSRQRSDKKIQRRCYGTLMGNYKAYVYTFYTVVCIYSRYKRVGNSQRISSVYIYAVRIYTLVFYKRRNRRRRTFHKTKQSICNKTFISGFKYNDILLTCLAYCASGNVRNNVYNSADARIRTVSI